VYAGELLFKAGMSGKAEDIDEFSAAGGEAGGKGWITAENWSEKPSRYG